MESEAFEEPIMKDQNKLFNIIKRKLIFIIQLIV